MENYKVCPDCGKNKLESEYTSSKFKRSDKGGKCKECIKIEWAEYREKNKEKIESKNKIYRDNHKNEKKEYDKKYQSDNKEEIVNKKSIYYKNNKAQVMQQNKNYYENNKEKVKEYHKSFYEENKDSINEYLREYRKNKRKVDPAYKCRMIVSAMVNRMLRSQNSSKKQESSWDYMPYDSPKAFIKHIESQFSLPENLDNNGNVWMTWENHKPYDNKTFDENDSSTWVWHIDHKIPQSDLPYESMTDGNFKKSWAPENIRPLRGDLNIKDGSGRIRHKK